MTTWGPPRASIEAECARRGRDDVVDGCRALLRCEEVVRGCDTRRAQAIRAEIAALAEANDIPRWCPPTLHRLLRTYRPEAYSRLRDLFSRLQHNLAPGRR